MKSNLIQDKSLQFSYLIIDFYKLLSTKKREFILSKQILRSGTSIGANIEEGIGASSKKDFFYKLTISYKEARETRYWLKLLKYYFKEELKIIEILERACEELLKILYSIIKHR